MTHAIVTCSEYFTELALNELYRQHKHLTCIRQISPQHLFIRHPASFGQLTKPWKNKLPIYLHHAFPVHKSIPLDGSLADLTHLRKHALELCSDDFVVQARIVGEYPHTLLSVAQSIRRDHIFASNDVPNGRVLSLLIDGRCAYMGISWAAQNLSPYNGGALPSDEPVPNRAGLKMIEALATFGVQLRSNDHALDLGAAPGAWTEVLRRRGLRVTAVAPQEMYTWLQADPGIQSYFMTAEDYLGQCDTTYDLIVNDMRLDARDSARLMVAYAQHLRPGGIAIMTLKLRMQHRLSLMDHALRILRKAYKIIRIRQLVSNRREVTLFLRRND
ncbi:MAG: methyltransferase domain-containing protein [Anaerolineaceae bacterium]|nr:methyltransferase domain-containing protein [Anaerolineaceae bacterium]